MENPLKTNPADMSIASSNDLTSLRDKAGWFGGIGADYKTGKAAANALVMVQAEMVRAEANIALTSLKLAEAAIRTSMVANAMPKIGALTTRVNAATTAVDQALTNGATAEAYTHLSNRAANIRLALELRDTGKATQEEAEVVISFAQADAAKDIERTRQRMAEAKDAVSGLHEFALKGIAAAKDRLQ